MLIAQTVPVVPFAQTTPWLVQIAQEFLAAAAGDAAKAKSIMVNATQTDAQWNAAHPSPNPGAFDYARNAYRAAYASLQGVGMFAQAQPAPTGVTGSPTTPTGASAGAPANGAAWKPWVVPILVVVAGILLLRKLA